MFGFSMIQMVRRHSKKMDFTLRQNLMNLYRPFRWTPCFLHGMFENTLKSLRSFPVIVEFENHECFEEGLSSLQQVSTIDIISMSLGSTPDRPAKDDPMVQIVEKAWSEGIVVCVAAGNSGDDPQTISSPGNSPVVITVGAMDDKDTIPSSEDDYDDEVASFSSRGPTRFDNFPKPDILAPGVNIISLRAPNSYLDKLQKSSRVEELYFELSGTSMATPICAGVVAQLLELNPNLSPDQVKEKLRLGAKPWGDRDENVYGAGYLDVKRSVELVKELGQPSS